MIIGRKEEIKYINDAYNDNYSHFIAVYGRRRIGKTFLIRECFNYNFTFEHSGLSDGTLDIQLEAFDSSLRDAGLNFKRKSKTWLEAFDKLKELIKNSSNNRKVIFIDELSWMDTPKSNLLIALEYFWNSFASARKDIILIVCSSATSWILNKIIHNKGGLYDRLSRTIHLNSFTLNECEQYLLSRDISIGRKQILEYYMVFGGVPFYWSFIEKGLSVTQNIDKILFKEDAPLKNEFLYLYASIFKNPEKYISIIKVLSTKKAGLSRDEIIKQTKMINSGDITNKLEELESCGFIRKYTSFGMKSKNALYQLIDNFTLFYYQFLSDGVTDEHFWANQLNTPAVNTWMGLSFERVCLIHINKIKEALGISGVLSKVNSWSCKKDVEKGINGSQIDLLIVRKDQVINLCEMKYSNTDFNITESFAEDLDKKINDLQTVTKTGYSIHPVLITTYGLKENKYSSVVQSTINLNDLFK